MSYYCCCMRPTQQKNLLCLTFIIYKNVNNDLNKIKKFLSIRLDFLASPTSSCSCFETLEKNIWQSKGSAFHMSYHLAIATILIMQNSMGSNKIWLIWLILENRQCELLKAMLHTNSLMSQRRLMQHSVLLPR